MTTQRMPWRRAFARSGMLALLVLATALPAAAQQLPAAVAAVIDYQRVIRESKAAGSIRSQIETRRKTYQDEIVQAEKRLREAEQALGKQRSVLSAEAFQQKRRAFDREVSDVQRMVADRRRELDGVSAVALREVRGAVLEAVSELAKTRGFNIVLPSSGVLVYSPQIDLTAEVLSLVDQRLPSVKVPDKAPPQQAGGDATGPDAGLAAVPEPSRKPQAADDGTAPAQEGAEPAN